MKKQLLGFEVHYKFGQVQLDRHWSFISGNPQFSLSNQTETLGYYLPDDVEKLRQGVAESLRLMETLKTVAA